MSKGEAGKEHFIKRDSVFHLLATLATVKKVARFDPTNVAVSWEYNIVAAAAITEFPRERNQS